MPARGSDARDELLAALSHDLRSPLGSLLVWLELLRRQDLGPEASRAAERIETGVRDLRDMVLRFLDMAQILSDRRSLELDDVDAGAAVDDALKACWSIAEVKGVRLQAALDASPSFRADRGCVARGLESLIANAVRTTPPGGSVDVRVESAADRVRFRVSDTGFGLRPETLSSISEALAAGLAPEGGGLPLAVAVGVARLHGGSLRGASDGEGRGSIYVLELPLHPPRHDVGGGPL
jgi:signal transduction histidine kinase